MTELTQQSDLGDYPGADYTGLAGEQKPDDDGGVDRSVGFTAIPESRVTADRKAVRGGAGKVASASHRYKEGDLIEESEEQEDQFTEPSRGTLKSAIPEPLGTPLFYTGNVADDNNRDVTDKPPGRRTSVIDLVQRQNSLTERRLSRRPSALSVRRASRGSAFLQRQVIGDLERRRAMASSGRRGTVAATSFPSKPRDLLTPGDVPRRGGLRSRSLQEAGSLLIKLSRWKTSLPKRSRGSTEELERIRRDKEINRARLRRIFQKVTNILMAFLKLQNNVKNSIWMSNTYQKQKESIEFLPEAEENPMFMIFDPSDFKANKQMRMTSEGRRVLQKPPDERSDSEVYYCQIALRGIKSIADYPVRMQQKLAKYGRFECYEPGRALVKQGHMPHAFYFILYGSVVVCVLDEETWVAETMCFLHRGESFGELSIMNGSARQSTVLTKTYVEVLSLDKETYESVFMVGGKKCITDPDHMQFLRGLQILTDWPMDILKDNTEEVMFCYFRRGSVIAKNTKHSKWIVVVKSGSVNMLKKLLKQKPRVHSQTGRFIPQGPNRRDILGAFQTNTLDDLLARCNLKKPGSSACEEEDDDDIFYYSDATSALQELEGEEGGGGMLHTGNRTIKQRAVASARPSDAKRTNQQNGKKRRRAKTAVSKVSTDDEDANSTPKGRRTFIDDLNGGDEQEEPSPADKNPEFVHIQTLTKGEAYGVAPLVFPDQPGFCLVSNGADCVLLNKDFYQEHCPPKLLRQLRYKLSPYPTEEKLQTDLQNRVNWDAYRAATINQILDARKTKLKDIYGRDHDL